MTVNKVVSYGGSIEKTERKVERSPVRCANCHRKEHYAELQPSSR